MLNKKIFISISILFLVFNLLIISSALELNPFAKKKIYESTLKEDMSDFLKEDFNSNYGVIRLSKTFFWIETDKVAEYSLIENTEQCSNDCSATKKVVLYEKGTLVDDIYFKPIKKGSSVDSYKLLLKNGTEIKSVPDYKLKCFEDDNGMIIDELGNIENKTCLYEISGYHKEEVDVWSEFNLKDIFDVGNYTIKLVGTKKSNDVVDWVIVTRGNELTEWSIWGESNLTAVLKRPLAWAGSSSPTGKFGVQINMSKDKGLINVTKSASSTPTKVYLQNADGSVTYATADFSGNVATFPKNTSSNLEGGIVYRIVVDNSGSSYTAQYTGTPSMPINADPNEFRAINLIVNGALNNANWWSGIETIEMAGLHSDPIPITINLTFPSDNYTLSGSISFNATIIPINANITNVTLNINDDNYTDDYNTNEILNYSKSLSLDDGSYTWNVTACILTAGDEVICITSDTRNLEIDSTAPQLTASLNETILYSEGQEVGLEYNITDSNLGSCWYTYNDINTSINCSETSATITTTLSALDVIVYANDSLGNLNQSETLSMTLDDTPPQLEIINPINNTNYDTFILLNISAIDDNLDSVWYNLNDGENITYTEPINIAGLQGINYLNVYANDTLDNTNSSSIIYYLEKLNIYLTSPLNDTITYYNPVTFIANATSLEGYLYNATLYYNDGSGWESESIYSGGIPNITSLDYTSKNFSVGGQDGTPIGLHFSINGDKMYIVGGGARVFQYTLSTPWDVSTASYNNKNFSVSSQDGVPYGLFIDRSGTRMYINGQVNDRVFQYTLSTPWDVSTASYDNKNFSVSTQIGASVPLGLYFSDLGDKMYVGGYTNEEIYQYNLSTPWDVSTASYETEIAVATIPYGLTFSSGGYSFLYPDRTNDRIYQYNLSTPWDVSTATIYDYNDISSQEGNPSGVYINFIGGFYMVGTDNDRVYQYDIGGSSLSVVYFNKSFNPGDIVEWNIEFCTTDNSCKFSEDNWTFTIDNTAPQLTANLNETILYSEGQEVGLEYNITDSNLGSCWYTYNDINTSINCSETSATITTTLSALDVIVYANDSLGNLNQSETLSMTLDPIIPEIILSAGNETSGYYYSGVNHTINFTINDDNLDSIWWEYNGVNTPISPAVSGEAQSITFEVDVGIYTATIYANDSIGNSNQLIVNWGYGLTEDSITFNPTTIEGSIEDYYLNLTLSGLSLTSAVFYYDGVATISQIDADGNERFIKVEDFEVPPVTTDEDKEFYWTLTFSDETIINSTFNNQSVSNIGINSCGGSYTYHLIDLYLKDEETTDTINGYIEVDYSIFNPTTETIAQNYSYLFENVNTASICSDLDLSDSDFLFDAQIRYYATNYSSELYNIQMGSLKTLTNLSLYYLAIDDSTEFLVTYQDENAIRVEGAIIQLLRKYVSKGIYRVVEAPETSAHGTTVLHIDLNSVIYDVIVVKDGVELDRFENVVFACDSAYSTLCTQNLYGTLDPGNSIPIETIDDFSYTLTTFNDSIKLTYSITSGVPSDINMILEQIDSFGSKINCNESVTSSGGSIECGFNETIGDSIVKVLVLRDGEPVAIKSYVLEEDRRIEFLGNNYFIALIILLSVVAMAFSSPEWIVMNGVFTMLILGGLTLVRGLNFTIGLGSLMWLIIAGAILVMKISKQEDR